MSYPVIIPDVPDVVLDRLRKFFVTPPEEVLARPAELWNGKSAIQAVADGDRTWEQILAEYDRIFAWEDAQ